MRNLRLYNTDAAFKAHEQAAGGDGNKTVTIVPGVSMSKDQRKRYFNPHDNSVLVYTLKENNYIVNTTTSLVPGATRKIKVVDGVNTTVNLTPRKIDHYAPLSSYETVTVPVDTSVTFYYKLNTFHRCVYVTDSDNQNIRIYYRRPSSGLTAISIDGKKYEINSKMFPYIDKTYTFETAGEHEVLFHYSASTFLTAATFYNTVNLVSAEIAFGTVSLGSEAFKMCTSLSSITIPTTVTVLDSDCFYNCSQLKNINLPDSLRQIGAKCFAQSGIENINIPDGVTTFGSGVFNGCSGLTGVTGKLPTYVPVNFFKDCYELKTIEIPFFSFKYYSRPYCYTGDYKTVSGYGFYGFGNQCFENCYKLELSGFSMAKEVSSYNKYNDDSLAITFGSNCFHNCYSISSLTLTAIEQEVGNHSYNSSDDCIGSTAFTTNVRFGESAFAGCSGLTKIVLPVYTTNLSANCFNGCSSLEEITCNSANEPAITNTTFYGIRENGTFKCNSSFERPTWMSTDQYYLGYYGWTRTSS